MTVSVGDQAPDFTAQTHDGAELTLSSLRGKRVVLYFYPKDDTPGCTTEACDFRDHFAAFKKKKVEVLGVSPDSVARHAKFRAKHELPFTLVADPDKAIANAYGVFKEKTMYGKKVMGIVRSTFLIDAHGKVIAAWPGVKVPGHVEAILAAL
jgi:peroxiredoxin Q/BCP